MLTPYQDVDEIIEFFVQSIHPIFQDNLTGVYLTGSLSYNAFNYDTSDIDITVVLTQPISPGELANVTQLHRTIERRFEKWSKRLECTYTPAEMLPSILPPKEPRPWYWGGDGKLYPEAPYGNEWITNNYILYHHAITLFVPAFNTLITAIDIADVQSACIRDLFTECESKKNDPDYFKDSHYTAYFILNLCRIFYTIMCASLGSKQTA